MGRSEECRGGDTSDLLRAQERPTSNLLRRAVSGLGAGAIRSRLLLVAPPRHRSVPMRNARISLYVSDERCGVLRAAFERDFVFSLGKCVSSERQSRPRLTA